MKTMILTAMMMIATSTAFAGKTCVNGKNTAWKNLAAIAQEIGAEVKPVQGDRRQAIDRTSPEFKALNAIGKVEVEGESFYGTGFLVSPCHVLTNSHVAYKDPKNAKVGSSVKFSVGQTGSAAKPFAEANISGKVIAHGNYENTDETRNSDWVVVKLSKSVGNTVGYIPLVQVKDPNKLVNRAVQTAGYPGNRTNGGKDFTNIYADLNCKINETNILGYLDHTCQNSGGQSGSPILTKDAKGQYYAIGMISGDNGYGMAAQVDPNKANMAVNFLSGANIGKQIQGDLIAAAIAGDKCE